MERERERARCKDNQPEDVKPKLDDLPRGGLSAVLTVLFFKCTRIELRDPTRMQGFIHRKDEWVAGRMDGVGWMCTMRLHIFGKK